MTVRHEVISQPANAGQIRGRTPLGSKAPGSSHDSRQYGQVVPERTPFHPRCASLGGSCEAADSCPPPMMALHVAIGAKGRQVGSGLVKNRPHTHARRHPPPLGQGVVRYEVPCLSDELDRMKMRLKGNIPSSHLGGTALVRAINSAPGAFAEAAAAEIAAKRTGFAVRHCPN